MFLYLFLFTKKKTTLSLFLETIIYFLTVYFFNRFNYFTINFSYSIIFLIFFILFNYLYLNVKDENIFFIIKSKFLYFCISIILINLFYVSINKNIFLSSEIINFFLIFFSLSLIKEIILRKILLSSKKNKVLLYHSIKNKLILLSLKNDLSVYDYKWEIIYKEKKNNLADNLDINIKSKENSKKKNKFIKLISDLKFLNQTINLLDFYQLHFQKIPHFLSEFIDFKKLSRKCSNSFYSKYFKRFFDIIFSVILLLLLSPIFIITFLLLRFVDKGPALYSQLRSGIKGKTIKIHKFRTMRIDAEKEGIKWAKENDPRITKIGRILRKTRIDELPQLISVIKGDMSLIGPRPERPQIDNILDEEITNYRYRYLIKPGLSGWAQVNYPYGASIEDAKNKLSYDLFYIKYCSFILDLIIFFKTIKILYLWKGSSPKEKMI